MPSEPAAARDQNTRDKPALNSAERRMSARDSEFDRIAEVEAAGAQDLADVFIVWRAGGQTLLVARRVGGAGVNPGLFGLRWFLPTLWRYRRPLGHVLAASRFVQIFALTTPLFFQVVVDKVLTHKGYETRPAGQTVARVRELETIRGFLTGQGLRAGLSKGADAPLISAQSRRVPISRACADTPRNRIPCRAHHRTRF
jgi:hypothetical protein